MNTYNIYALRVTGTNSFFYVGLTMMAIEKRLCSHFHESRSGVGSNKDKIGVIVSAEFCIDSILIEHFTSNKRYAREREDYWIECFLNDGHPLTNKVRIAEYKESDTKKILIDIPLMYLVDMKEAAKESGQSVKSFIEVAAIEKVQKIKKAKSSK